MEKVIISVYWPDDWKKIVLTPAEWREIKRGEIFEDSGEEYHYEGERFYSYWTFNEDYKGSLRVSYNDGGEGFNGSISECEIEFGVKRKYLNLEKFLAHYDTFIRIPTWTKQKQIAHLSLKGYLTLCRQDYIISSKGASSQLNFMNSFTIFKVDDKKNGKLKQFRGNWVLLYMAGKSGFQRYLDIYPLKKGIDNEINQNLKMRFPRSYIDSLK